MPLKRASFDPGKVPPIGTPEHDRYMQRVNDALKRRQEIYKRATAIAERLRRK